MQYVGDLQNDRNGKAQKEVLDQDSTDPDASIVVHASSPNTTKKFNLPYFLKKN